MIRKRRATTPNKIVVTFEIPGTIWAERINLVGDFNDWNEESLPFRYDRLGNWIIEIELTIGQDYRFRYLFDGSIWGDEYEADRFEPNDYGTHDAVIVAELPDEEES